MKSMPKLAVGLAFGLVAMSGRASGDPLATERHVHGVITSVEPTVLTISVGNRTVTGRIDPARTKVTVNGKSAKATDLKPPSHAKAELCLDDVWIKVDAHEAH
ncbi:MAG: hypothetical protein JST00_40020 [Deltaproteobacteria bacterium]|nr:hypothetical protein [Deltaproteobacteria bacterium]